jgi:hypothetical protein
MRSVSKQQSRRVLRVQTVLFGSDLRQLWRLLHGLDAAARQVVDSGLVGRVEWAMGDSSPGPMLGDADISAMSDASSEAVSAVTYEFFNANLGSSGGQNRLAKDAGAELLLVLNPDTYPSPTALIELVKAIDTPGVGVVEARQIPLEHPREYDLTSGDTSWASGYCMLVRRALFEELDGFDEAHFLLHCDDVDFSWRARAAGYRVVIAPFASVFHDKRPELGDAWPAPDVEQYHAALGRLMLATRWGRPDIVDDTVAWIEAGASDVQRAALHEFRTRAAAGKVPERFPNASDVAEFVGGEYATHRF